MLWLLPGPTHALLVVQILCLLSLHANGDSSGGKLGTCPESHSWQSINYNAGKDTRWESQWLSFETLKAGIVDDFWLISKELSAKSIRTFIPRNLLGPTCSAKYMDRIDAFLHLATSQSLSVILGLDYGTALGNKTEMIQFVECLGGRFGKDERILAWDLINLPDQIDGWTTGHPHGNFTPQAVDILNATFKAMESSMTQDIMATAGCMHGPEKVVDLCNMFPGERYVPAMHTVPAFTTINEYSYQQNIHNWVLRAFQGCRFRQVFLSGWGRPGHKNKPTYCLGPNNGLCNEENQRALYMAFARAVTAVNQQVCRVAGVAPWTFDDVNISLSGNSSIPEKDMYCGVYRGQARKPAATVLASWYWQGVPPADDGFAASTTLFVVSIGLIATVVYAYGFWKANFSVGSHFFSYSSVSHYTSNRRTDVT